MGKPRFEVSDKVEKPVGYRFPGVVIGTDTKLNGTLLYLVEADHPDFEGMTHIFNENQLVQRIRKPLPGLPFDVMKGQVWKHTVSENEYIVSLVSYDEDSLRPLVSYSDARTSTPFTRDYRNFIRRFRRVS
jgi:hypothetical protein